MGQPDYDQILSSRWGLTEIPFTTSAPTTFRQDSQIQEVFTGQDKELEKALITFSSRERRRILVYGQPGIGKTAFISKLLGRLKKEKKRTIATYISLPSDAQDLATVALDALARTSEMKNDQYAQHILQLLGRRPRRIPVIKETEVDAKFVRTKETQVPPGNLLQDSSLSFESLLEHALLEEEYDRVIIAIDDVNKEDLNQTRKMLRDAQGMLKGAASFILASHYPELAKDKDIYEAGLIDSSIELKVLDEETLYKMLIRYLNNARPDRAKCDPNKYFKKAEAVKPFTIEAAYSLCLESEGVPRNLNHLGSNLLNWALVEGVEEITLDIYRRWLKGYRGKFSYQNLTPKENDIVEAVLSEQLSKEEMSNEAKPILDRFVEFDPPHQPSEDISSSAYSES